MYLTIAKWVGGALLGLMVAWIVYAGLIRPTTKPNPSTNQSAETIVNHNYASPKVYFGCMSIKAYEREKNVDKISNSISPSIP